MAARLLVLAVFLAGPAFGQSFNVDFGTGSVTPADTYPAVAQQGYWNEVGVLPSLQRQPLSHLWGAPSAASIYMIGGTDLLVSDDPLTSGDDEALMDDMLIGWNDPVDVCIWFENLENAEYAVIIYAMTPNDPSLQCRVRVDFGSPGPQMVGGAWPGFHQDLVTYGLHEVMVTDGTIGLHSGLWNGLIQSGINGIQIIKLSGTGVEKGTASAPGAGIRGVYPNPSAGPQVIELALPRPFVSGRVEIHDVTGRLVWSTGIVGLLAGPHRVTWDGRTHSSALAAPGVYFVRLQISGPEQGDVARLIRVR